MNILLPNEDITIFFFFFTHRLLKSTELSIIELGKNTLIGEHPSLQAGWELPDL